MENTCFHFNWNRQVSFLCNCPNEILYFCQKQAAKHILLNKNHSILSTGIFFDNSDLGIPTKTTLQSKSIYPYTKKQIIKNNEVCWGLKPRKKSSICNRSINYMIK